MPIDPQDPKESPTTGYAIVFFDDKTLNRTHTRFLYRGDLRVPEEIFTKGFKSRGLNPDLFRHVLHSKGNFVSTSSCKLTAKEYPYGNKELIGRTQALPARSAGYLYEINIPKNAISVEEILRHELAAGRIHQEQFDYYRLEKEWVVPKEIKAHDIRRAWPIEVHAVPSTLAVDEFTINVISESFMSNPDYVPSNRTAPMPSQPIIQTMHRLTLGAGLIGMGLDARRLYKAYTVSKKSGNNQEFFRVGSEILGGVTGALTVGTALAKAGALSCAALPPYGPAVCGLVGGVVGSIAGYKGGSAAGLAAFDTMSNNDHGDIFKPIAKLTIDPYIAGHSVLHQLTEEYQTTLTRAQQEQSVLRWPRIEEDTFEALADKYQIPILDRDWMRSIVKHAETGVSAGDEETLNPATLQKTLRITKAEAAQQLDGNRAFGSYLNQTMSDIRRHLDIQKSNTSSDFNVEKIEKFEKLTTRCQAGMAIGQIMVNLGHERAGEIVSNLSSTSLSIGAALLAPNPVTILNAVASITGLVRCFGKKKKDPMVGALQQLAKMIQSNFQALSQQLLETQNFLADHIANTGEEIKQAIYASAGQLTEHVTREGQATRALIQESTDTVMAEIQYESHELRVRLEWAQEQTERLGQSLIGMMHQLGTLTLTLDELHELTLHGFERLEMACQQVERQIAHSYQEMSAQHNILLRHVMSARLEPRFALLNQMIRNLPHGDATNIKKDMKQLMSIALDQCRFLSTTGGLDSGTTIQTLKKWHHLKSKTMAADDSTTAFLKMGEDINFLASQLDLLGTDGTHLGYPSPDWLLMVIEIFLLLMKTYIDGVKYGKFSPHIEFTQLKSWLEELDDPLSSCRDFLRLMNHPQTLQHLRQPLIENAKQYESEASVLKARLEKEKEEKRSQAFERTRARFREEILGLTATVPTWPMHDSWRSEHQPELTIRGLPSISHGFVYYHQHYPELGFEKKDFDSTVTYGKHDPYVLEDFGQRQPMANEADLRSYHDGLTRAYRTYQDKMNALYQQDAVGITTVATAFFKRHISPPLPRPNAPSLLPLPLQILSDLHLPPNLKQWEEAGICYVDWSYEFADDHIKVTAQLKSFESEVSYPETSMAFTCSIPRYHDCVQARTRTAFLAFGNESILTPLHDGMTTGIARFGKENLYEALKPFVKIIDFHTGRNRRTPDWSALSPGTALCRMYEHADDPNVQKLVTYLGDQLNIRILSNKMHPTWNLTHLGYLTDDREFKDIFYALFRTYFPNGVPPDWSKWHGKQFLEYVSDICSQIDHGWQFAERPYLLLSQSRAPFTQLCLVPNPSLNSLPQLSVNLTALEIRGERQVSPMMKHESQKQDAQVREVTAERLQKTILAILKIEVFLMLTGDIAACEYVRKQLPKIDLLMDPEACLEMKLETVRELTPGYLKLLAPDEFDLSHIDQLFTDTQKSLDRWSKKIASDEKVLEKQNANTSSQEIQELKQMIALLTKSLESAEQARNDQERAQKDQFAAFMAGIQQTLLGNQGRSRGQRSSIPESEEDSDRPLTPDVLTT